MARDMRRRIDQRQLYITVPSQFQCPISLDVMKSPVSLCTGVTYDRSSIQHWLDSGHDTCPATMQVLPSKDFVPNLTLHRLISLWSSSSSATPQSPLSPPPPSPQQVRVWIETADTDSLAKIAEFAEYSADNRKFLVSFDGFFDTVKVVLNRDGVEIRDLELVIRVLNLIMVENGVKEKLNKMLLNSQNWLAQFVNVLREGSLKLKIETVIISHSILINNDSKRFVAETPNFVPVLLQILNQNDDAALNDVVLSFFVSIITTRSIKAQLVQLGLVPALSKILTNKNAAVSVVEKCLKLLSSVSMGPDGRAAISGDPTCVACAVERLMKVSKTATEDAVLVLWGLCCLFRDGKVQDNVVRCNGVTKVLLVMQSLEEGNVRRMCGDLVKVLRYKSDGVGSYETRTTHIMPC